MALSVGDRLGPYEILAPIGAGERAIRGWGAMSPLLTVVVNWHAGLKK